MGAYDIYGNIAVLKFRRGVLLREKKKVALRFLEEHKSVSTVLEKVEKFSRRLRTQKTKWLAGEKTKEALYRENDCVFRFNVDSCYFSPRLASERKEIALKVKKGENVLVMFGGVAPFAIVIGKLSKASRIDSVELGRECNKYAKENVKRNKVEVKIVQGDVRRVIGKGKVNAQESVILGATKPGTAPARRMRQGFVGYNRIIMARPNLKDNFLDVAFSRIRKGGVIHYYGFCLESEKGKLREMILREAKKARMKIKIMKIKKAGEIGTKKFRYRIDLKVL
jgi:tRNA (guanine37-N1)-methyltransferase